jgi:hypothetical protein
MEPDQNLIDQIYYYPQYKSYIDKGLEVPRVL